MTVRLGGFMTAIVAVVVAVLAVRLIVVCLIDLDRRTDRELQYLNRTAWSAVIVLAVPLGGVAYLLYGRKQ